MSIETSGFSDPRAETADSKGSAKSSGRPGKIGTWIKAAAATVGVAAIGQVGEIPEGMVASPDVNIGNQTNTVHVERSGDHSPEDSSDLAGTFQVLHDDVQASWGVEYVPKKHENGKSFLAQKFVKINHLTHETTVLGEYDNVIAAARGLSAMPDVPAGVKAFAQGPATAIQNERNLQATGLVEPSESTL